MTLLCASVIGPSFNEALKQLRAIEKEGDIVEFRLDKMSGVTQEQVNKLIKLAKKPTIATFRSAEEGGAVKVPTPVRIERLKQCIDAGVSLVDVELAESWAAREVANYANSRGAKTIISYHNFKKTPNASALMSVVRRSRELRADVVKIATNAQNVADEELIIKMMRFCKLRQVPFVAIGMNPNSARTRFSAINEGAFLTFGRIGAGSAPGQPTLSELKQYKRNFLRQKARALNVVSVTQKEKSARVRSLASVARKQVRKRF